MRPTLTLEAIEAAVKPTVDTVPTTATAPIPHQDGKSHIAIALVAALVVLIAAIFLML